MTLTAIDYRIASSEALAHAMSCKRCQKCYIKILMHATEITDKITQAMIDKDISEEK